MQICNELMQFLRLHLPQWKAVIKIIVFTHHGGKMYWFRAKFFLTQYLFISAPS